MERIEVLVVDASVDDVHGLVTARRAHEHVIVAAVQVAALDELDTHLAGEERMLEVRRIVNARREDDNSGVAHARRRGCS